MRVLHINCNYIGTTLHQLMVERLDKLGYENQVFVPTYDKNLSVISTNENVYVSECFKKWDRLVFDYKQRKIMQSIECNLDVVKYDLIHAYTLFTDGNCARKLFKRYEIPYVVAIRNTDVNSFLRLMPYLRSRGVKTMLDAKGVFFLSEAYQKQVFEKYIPHKYHEIIQRKTYIIPNGIDDFWFNNILKEENKLDDTIKLIYVGRIDKNKNISTTQEAMKILRNRGYNITLTVVGRVADKKVFETIMLDPYTKYIQAKPKEELITLYREHDMFVMPSFTESFGLVYAEAMSQGLPVIYTRGQGFDRQFEEGIVGYHVSADDAEDVANGIEKAINNYAVISRECVNRVLKFNWSEITNKYADIYENIL